MQAAGGGEEGMAQRGRKLVIEWAAEDDAAGLQARYRRERQADVRPRLHGLWLPRTGRSARETAGVLGGRVHRGRDVRPAGAAAVRAEGAAPGSREGRPPRASAVEKRGLTAALATVGLRPSSVVGFADELRLGLRGTTRRVWGRRGV